MADNIEQNRGKVPLKDFLADFRSHFTDHELREKYELSAKAFVSLIKALLAKSVITAADLEKRKVMAVQRDLAKESEFLSGLFICPNCSHPHPKPFERCPACGADPADFMPRQEILDPLSASGAHFYVDDDTDTTDRTRDRKSNESYFPPTEELRLPEEYDKDYPPTEEIRPEEVEEDYPPTEELRVEQDPPAKHKKSAADQLRSLIARIKKK
ncbi:MAG: hypothetical protein HY912_14865 [Desulfomonile tiedjei]|uniref:Uncharacterized protein n=1 Tax=Desulfomonile tiedjei TaxID=2358 RepID=A0A9D6Z4C0_9BACT|nr:hypothetical protein [Desulfomonile tiedjei]